MGGKVNNRAAFLFGVKKTMNRISVPLDKSEFAALLDMATTDCRHPREQMRYILREEAQRRGLLTAENSNGASDTAARPAEESIPHAAA